MMEDIEAELRENGDIIEDEAGDDDYNFDAAFDLSDDDSSGKKKKRKKIE